MNFLFRTPYNYDYTQEPMEQNNQPSETLPGMAITIKELVARYMAGQPLNVSLHVDYDPDGATFDDVDRLMAPDADLTDITEMQIDLARKEAQAKADEEAQRTQEAQRAATVEQASGEASAAGNEVTGSNQ